MNEIIQVIGLIFAIAIAVWFYVGIPAQMARARGRSEGWWMLVSLVIGPLFAIILLALLGDARK